MSVYAIRTLEQMMALANGGEFQHDFQSTLRALQLAMQHHLQEHQAGCEAALTLGLKLKADRHGEVEIILDTKVRWPAPPTPAGRGRAYLGTDGEITRHPQEQMDLIRDVGSRPTGLRDVPEARKDIDQ